MKHNLLENDFYTKHLIVVVVVVTRPLPRNEGMAEGHGAPEAGESPRPGPEVVK